MVVAMRAGLGVCAVGPAAVGKTETCREAARIVARPFVVLSCSESLALTQVLKFLKVLIYSFIYFVYKNSLNGNSAICTV